MIEFRSVIDSFDAAEQMLGHPIDLTQDTRSSVAAMLARTASRRRTTAVGSVRGSSSSGARGVVAGGQHGELELLAFRGPGEAPIVPACNGGLVRRVVEERRPVPLEHHYLVGSRLHPMHIEQDGILMPNPYVVSLDQHELKTKTYYRRGSGLPQHQRKHISVIRPATDGLWTGQWCA